MNRKDINKHLDSPYMYMSLSRNKQALVILTNKILVFYVVYTKK